ncbi:hypothetical protein ABVN80_19790 [Acinetobacter baumannii]
MVSVHIYLQPAQQGLRPSIPNLWALGGFFPFGIEGLVMAMAVIDFCFWRY